MWTSVTFWDLLLLAWRTSFHTSYQVALWAAILPVFVYLKTSTLCLHFWKTIKKYLFILSYLAVPGLSCGIHNLFSCGMQTPSCGMWDLVFGFFFLIFIYLAGPGFSIGAARVSTGPGFSCKGLWSLLWPTRSLSVVCRTFFFI